MMMELTDVAAAPSRLPSAAGRERLMACRGDPLFYADWLDAVFLHFETDPVVLQQEVPWPLDLFDGRAFVSLVAFTMRDLRPRLGGRLAALPFRPIATHEFLNVRVYVRHAGEPGIHFLAEWVPNALSVALGPTLFGLPYRLGTLNYDHDFHGREARGRVEDTQSGKAFAYACTAAAETAHQHCEAGSLDEFMVERYTAFTSIGLPGGKHRGWPLLRRLFRIWHPPWPLTPVQAEIQDSSLLSLTGDWSRHARLVSAHHSPGVEKVWMGRPHFVSRGDTA
ncbi:MAG: DUF2071 domain-containing protein [Prosthecobacter sp.]|nr:DUF2071 domain-containing protein [Prosthecobacter sp.]